MNTQQNKKLEKSVITKQAPEEIVRQKSVVKTKPVKEKKIKQREEGFSVYLMGANEERIKNLRKKEQIDRMMKSRLANNSKSIHNRIKCETKPEKMDQVLIESRSHSRHHPINSALIPNNISSSKIIINDNKFSEASHNYKISTSKDSLNNIEDMLSNINLMNKNLASNLNKLSGDSPYNKRRRNEIKYGIVDFSSTGREKSQNNSKIANKQNVDIKGTNTDETNKENESKTININLNIRSRGSLKNTFEDSTTKKVNAYTEAIDYDNMLSDHSMTNDFNKSIHKQIMNYKLSINDRPISSIMNLSNLKNTQENIVSPANLISINRPNRPYSQIHVRTRDRLSNRNEIVTNKTEFDFQSNSNVATNTNKKLMNNLTNLNINSPNQNIISPMIINTINSTKDYHFNSNKKNDIISKINQFDEKKISKLARLLERFDNIDVEESNEFNTDNKPNKNESHIFNKKLHPINKFNTNYFPGNNQIPNNHDNNQDSLEDEIPLKLSLSKLKLNLNSSMSNKIADGLNIKRDSILVKDNSNIPNINETLRKTSLKEQEYCSPRHPQKNYKSITINLISNYGHPEKIGLTEIQIFDRTNKKINILDCRIGNSEGNIIKIFNNKFHTIDENEMWNANFADRVKLFLYFEAIYEVQFITFWNFNGKDLNKGAKEIEIIVEGNYAYRGKISKGCFNVKSNYSTTISLNSYNFNNDKYNFDIGSNFTPLSEIKSHLGQKSTINSASKIIKLEIDTSHLNNIPNAQKTLENKKVDLIFDMEENICYSNREKKLEIKEDAAGISLNLNSNILYNNISRSQASLTLDELSNLRPKSNHFISCQTVKIYFTSNWGDPNYVGLTAIEFLDDKLNPFNYNEISSFNAHPRDMNTAFGDGSDIRVLENLFNNENMVNDIENMWLTVLNRDDPPYLEICFEKMVLLSGIRIWNYNKKYELDRGVRSLEVQFDDHLFYEHSIIIRKGIGESNLDYSQSIIFPVEEILFSETDLARFSEIKPASLRLTQDFETPYLPVGFNYKITLLSNWGDPIYIGLNQIEFYDQNGDKILNHTNPRFLSFPDNLQSFSDNDNDIKSIKNSDREVSILLKYINTKIVDKIDCDPNSIFFIFDKPIIMSFIKFSNYTKNSNIAVKDFLITCDDVIIYKGILRKPETESVGEDTCVFFTSESAITHAHEDKIYSESDKIKNYEIIENENETICLTMTNDKLELENDSDYSIEK